MKLNKSQLFAITFFLALFALLYFGCDTKTKEHKDLEKSRAENFELLNIKKMIGDKRSTLSAKGQSELLQLENKLQAAEDSEKIELKKSMASLWYAEGHPIVSGYYAEQIANSSDTEGAWSIAGTTYSLAAQNTKDEIQVDYAIGKARESYKKAIALNPENVDNQINMALSYVDVMDKENPMKGILMLRDLNTKHPENVSVLFQLGRLSLGTNQLEKAVTRLSKVVELDPNFKNAHCLLAETYTKLGNVAKAAQSQQNCDKK